MKKYFLGLSALVCAIAFSAFTKPYVLTDFKLLQDPVAANIVNDDAKWAQQGGLFGRCDELQNDIACVIQLNVANQAAYFHNDGENDVLNTFAYANAQTPKKDYLEITEAVGAGSDRIIQAIQPKHFDPTAAGGVGAYVNASLGADIAFKNARD
jgi:hypothetical protein